MTTHRGLADDRVEWYLWAWERYMWSAERWQSYCRADGSPTVVSTAFDNRRAGYQWDMDDAYDECCRIAAKAVQAILDGLTPRLRLAVYVKHAISEQSALRAVYVLRGDPEANYAEACGVLAIRLSARGLC